MGSRSNPPIDPTINQCNGWIVTWKLLGALADSLRLFKSHTPTLLTWLQNVALLNACRKDEIAQLALKGGFVLSKVSFGKSSLKGVSEKLVGHCLKEQAVLGHKIAQQYALEKRNINNLEILIATLSTGQMSI